MHAGKKVWKQAVYMKLATLIGAIAVSSTTVEAQSLKHKQQVLPQVKYEPGVLPQEWFTGGPGCAIFIQDFQIHKYNDDFYILRESGCVHAEKPFLYLLFGNHKAILFDTGAGSNTDPTTGRDPNVVGVVDQVINEWLARNNRKSIHLVVTHLHSHFDHIFGDPQFANRPHTTLVPCCSVDALKAFFRIKNWPHDTTAFDLGRRTIDIIPIPGHDETSIAVYDRRTGVLLTGDTLYPGRIYINEPNPKTFASSIQRLVDFTSTRLVTHVLGTHIEQRAPYYDYPIGTHHAPDEIPLQLGRAHLLELLEATTLRSHSDDGDRKDGSNRQITQKAYRDFTICGPYPECNPVNAPPR